MRMAALAVALALAGCEGMSIEEYERGRFGVDPHAPLSDHEIRAAIVNDVRTTWLPEAQLDLGTPACDAVRSVDVRFVCAKDQAVMKEFKVRADAPDRPHPVAETAYFCPAEGAYWYHYVGGPERRDTWLGPRRLRLRKPAEKS